MVINSPFLKQGEKGNEYNYEYFIVSLYSLGSFFLPRVGVLHFNTLQAFSVMPVSGSAD